MAYKLKPPVAGELIYTVNGKSWKVLFESRQLFWFAKPTEDRGNVYKHGDITRENIRELLRTLDKVVVDGQVSHRGR